MLRYITHSMFMKQILTHWQAEKHLTEAWDLCLSQQRSNIESVHAMRVRPAEAYL